MRKILLVEDEKIVAFDIKMMLNMLENITIKLATTSHEAIKLIDEEKPDLILMDINLSGERDGIETAELINKKNRIPIIYLTAFADETTLERAKRTEPVGYLLKPFNEAELKTNVEIALYKHEIAEKYFEKELWLTNALAKTGIGIIKTRDTNEMIYMNDVAERFIGMDADEASGKRLDDLIVFFEEDTGKQLSTDFLKDKRKITLELVNRQKTHFPVMFSIQSIKEVDGARTRIYILEDLTQKREAEKTIWSTKNLLEQTFHILQDALIIMNAEFLILDCNQAVVSLFGYEKSELIGKSVNMLWQKERGKQPEFSKLQQVLQSGSSMKRHELEMRKKDGRRFPAEFTIAPLPDRMNRTSGWIFSITDNSERKDYERRLRVARDQAEAANRAKSEFIANMSHELRTPLNSIIGMTELTLDTELTRDQRESLEIVRQSSLSFLQLLNTILDFTKIEIGKIELEEIDYNIIELINETIEVLQIQAVKKGLTIASDIDPKVPRFILGDPLRLKQVLMNLVGNAVKFTEKGFIRITLELSGDKEKIKELTCTVQDTGIGIPKNKLDVIFDSFRQLDGSTTRKYGGTGLGLTITKRLIELMKGSIAVDSEENKGSCFTFTIPIREGSEKSSTTKKKRRRIPSREKLSMLKVLVAEDDPIAQKMIHRVLEKRGHTVFCVSDGNAAIETLQKVKFDVLLMDIEMPVLNGLDATRKIRDMQRTPHIAKIPIVAMTAHARREDRERCLQMGMDHYLAKPIDLGELIAIIESYENVHADGSPMLPGAGLTVDLPVLIDFKKELEKQGKNAYTFIKEEFFRHMEAMKYALGAADHEILEKEADLLKQFAEKLGAVAISEEAFRIKMAARKKTLFQAKENMLRLELEFDDFYDQIGLMKEMKNEERHDENTDR